MIPFFTGYALVVWLSAYAGRRRVSGLVAAVAGVLGLLAVLWFYAGMHEWSGGRFCPPVFRTVLYPYIALVGGVGAMLAFAPRPFTAGAGRYCSNCRHDLTGLPQSMRVCPECAAPRAHDEIAARSAVRERQLRMWAPLTPDRTPQGPDDQGEHR